MLLLLQLACDPAVQLFYDPQSQPGEESPPPPEASDSPSKDSPDPEAKDSREQPPADSPAPKGSTHIVALGDVGMGSSDESLQYPVAASLEQVCSRDGCDWAVLLGDNFYPDGVVSAEDPKFQEMFITPYAGLEIPFYVSLGNHDYAESPKDGSIDVSAAAHQLSWKGSPWWQLPASHYQVEFPGLQLLALDTTLLSRGRDEQGAAARSEQYETIPALLEKSSKPFRLGIGHHPYLSNGKHGSAGSYDGAEGSRCDPGSMDREQEQSGICFKEFFEAELCDELDLYLSGHDHSLQVLEPTAACPTRMVVVGSSGKVDADRNLPSGETQIALSETHPYRWQALEAGFVWLSVCHSGRLETLRVYGLEGELLYEELEAACEGG